MRKAKRPGQSRLESLLLSYFSFLLNISLIRNTIIAMHTITSPNTAKNAIPAVPTTTAIIIPISINATTNAPNNNISLFLLIIYCHKGICKICALYLDSICGIINIHIAEGGI